MGYVKGQKGLRMMYLGDGVYLFYNPVERIAYLEIKTKFSVISKDIFYSKVKQIKEMNSDKSRSDQKSFEAV